MGTRVQPGRTRDSATRSDLVTAAESALGLLRPVPVITIRKPDVALRDFLPGAWSVLEPANPLVPGWHSDAICEHLEACSRGEIRDLIINMPPRMSKSLHMVIWNAWEWTFAPHIRYVSNSYSQPLSTRDSVKCRRLIESGWYRRRWGDRFKLTSDQNEKTRFDNDRMGFRIATSVGGTNTGEGGDRIVVDDPNNIKKINSPAHRAEVIEWWDQTMSTRGNNIRTRVRVIVMQRGHESDLTGHILSKDKTYVHLKLPMEYDGHDLERDTRVKKATVIGWRDPRTTTGELLQPTRFNHAEVARLKTDLGSYAASAQLQQEPAPAKGTIFDESYFKFYTLPDVRIFEPYLLSANRTIEPQEVVTMPPVWHMSAQSWDMTFKGTKKNLENLGSDYVVGHTWRRLGADVFLMPHEERGQWELPETIAAVLRMTDVYPDVITKYVEDKANGPAVMQMLRKQVQGFIPIDPQQIGDGGDTLARARAAAPIVEAGNVYLPHPKIAPWITDYLVEMTKFPKAPKDDRVAATAQILLIMHQDIRAARRLDAELKAQEEMQKQMAQSPPVWDQQF